MSNDNDNGRVLNLNEFQHVRTTPVEAPWYDDECASFLEMQAMMVEELTEEQVIKDYADFEASIQKDANVSVLPVPSQDQS